MGSTMPEDEGGEESKRRRKLAIAALLLAVPYVTWVAWAGGTHNLPSHRLLPVIFVLNSAICWGILMLYRRYLYRRKD